jgi:hypothetical protein
VRRVFATALAVVVCSCGADHQRTVQTEGPSTTAVAEVVTTTTLVQTPTAAPWSAPAPVPGREPHVFPAHRRIDDRDEFLLRFADGQAMILSLAEPWGAPDEFEARPKVNLTLPGGNKFSGPIMDPPSLLTGVCFQNCVELDQETRPDGGRNRRFQQRTPNREPSELVMIEFANWALLVPSYDAARSFTLETIDGFPVAHQQTGSSYRVGPAEMFLCIRSCAARMIVERMGADACAARLKTEPNDHAVSNSCIGEWHLYLDATYSRVNEVRAALTLRPAD